nr:MAG TPA: hypothetical protein [Crassvirales sp.]
METRNVKITIEQAATWYSSNIYALKALALSAFSRDELILYYVKTQSKTVSLDLPQGQIDKFKTLAQLSVLASYFNKITKIERGARYFLGKNNEVNHSLASTLFDNIYIYKHINVTYAGIIYFNSEVVLRKAVSMIGEDKIRRLFMYNI